jgi:hypothetical protein
VTLTPSQTVSFLASDLDPTVTGYMVALAVDENGIPAALQPPGGECVRRSLRVGTRPTCRRWVLRRWREECGR